MMEGGTALFPSHKMVRWFFLLSCDTHILHFLHFIHQKVFWTEHGALFGN